MAIRILQKEKDVLELDLGDIDQSIAQMITEKLNETKGVEFAACKVPHPVIGTPHLIVRTKGANASELVAKKLEEIRKEVEEFRKQFSEISG
ncbi:hypothetical protein H0O02_01905 [Candidatus Micrarchaeota archaeon]|nr:hypothetical protein [Candidatus Micrarchaeota archaeon]